MRQSDMNPNLSGAWWRESCERICGKWTYLDSVDDGGYRVRYIRHHGTTMGLFREVEPDKWCFVPLSTGWGSASDQQGMNKIMPSGWRYRRNNNTPRYVYCNVVMFVGVD